MINLEQILVVVLFSLNLICLILGYILGKFVSNTSESLGIFSDTKNNKVTNIRNTKKIDIDTSKVVTKINTDSLEKKYETLAETKSSQEKIENSVNKLKNMKG
jgi:hypothetical protein